MNAVEMTDRLFAVLEREKIAKRDDLLGRSRRQEVSLPRALCALILYEHTAAPLMSIAACLGRDDHTTAMSLIKRAAKALKCDNSARYLHMTLIGSADIPTDRVRDAERIGRQKGRRHHQMQG